MKKSRIVLSGVTFAICPLNHQPRLLFEVGNEVIAVISVDLIK